MAAVVSILLFAIGHGYQGRTDGLRAGVFGAILTGVVFFIGWLVPAMILHALIESGSGIVAFALLRGDDVAASATRPSPH